MSERWFQIFLVFTCGISLGCSAFAGNDGSPKCESALRTFPDNLPVVLNDPRSGLLLYVESDNRHMAAITRDGKILWHRNLFEGLKGAPPPYILPGEAPPSRAEQQRRVRAYLERLTVDRIGPVPDCAVHSIDHEMAPPFRGHYIQLGSGNHLSYLLDAKTGDIIVDMIN